MNGPRMSATTSSHVPHCSTHAGTKGRRGRGKACSVYIVALISGPVSSLRPLAEDLVPAGLELRVVVDELLAERHEDDVLLADLRVDVGERVGAVLRREAVAERGEARITH